MPKDRYESPLASRYASDFMLCLFSPDTRFQTWRRLWVALARAEHNLGLPVTAEQVAELEAKLSHEQSEKESAQSALARLNEQLTTLKMTLEANSADKAVVDEAPSTGKAVVDKAPVEAMDAAGSV